LIKLRHEFTVDRPVSEVFAAYADHEGHYAWQSQLVHKKAGHVTLRKGTKVTEVHNFVGRKVEIKGSITEFEKDKEIGFTGTGPSTRNLHYVTRMSPAKGGTRVATAVELDVQDFLGLATPLIERVVMRDLVKASEAFKDTVEMAAHHAELKKHLPRHDHHAAPAAKAPAKRAPAKRAPAKRAAAPAKRAAAPAKRAAAPAKRATASKAPARRSAPAARATARKAPAKRSARPARRT
jgi:uncharacterized protein YndB with AHSA1/START domain